MAKSSMATARSRQNISYKSEAQVVIRNGVAAAWQKKEENDEENSA